jgi:hypothetical protein
MGTGIDMGSGMAAGMGIDDDIDTEIFKKNFNIGYRTAPTMDCSDIGID